MTDPLNSKPEPNSPRLLASVKITEAELRLMWDPKSGASVVRWLLTLATDAHTVRALALGLSQACQEVALEDLRDEKR